MIRNASVLPTNYELFTDKSLSKITFTDDDIGKIIRGLDPNKSYGHDMMSIGMLKICGNSIYKSLGLQSLLGFLFKIWKRSTLFLFIKKRQKINKELQTSFTSSHVYKNIRRVTLQQQ